VLLRRRDTPTSRLAIHNYLKVFASEDSAETWLRENDLEGVGFEYPVEGI
jgi:hypothetical protein